MEMETDIPDEIVREIPVYLSKSLFNQLHIFQYPVRSQNKTYDEEKIQARIKPEAMQVELDVDINTKSKTYDIGRGEQIAASVDGSMKEQNILDSNDGSFFSSHLMDKLVLTSSKSLACTDRFGVAIMGENSLHITPVTSILSFRPCFNYMDKATQRSKQDQNNDTDNQCNDSEEEESIKKVNVRFERPETERSKAIKEKSYSYLQKKKRDEPWIQLKYNKFNSDKSEYDSELLYCNSTEDDVSPFDISNHSYLCNLIPPTRESFTDENCESSPMLNKLQSLMLSCRLASFSQILNAVSFDNPKKDRDDVLHLINRVAVLVQGNWVVKSDLVYPIDAECENPNDLIHKARDCLLYKFTKNRIVTRSSIAELLPIPNGYLTDLFKEVSKCEGARGTWTFKLPTDENFLQINTDVAQRQQMIWESRYTNMSGSFKI